MMNMVGKKSPLCVNVELQKILFKLTLLCEKCINSQINIYKYTDFCQKNVNTQNYRNLRSYPRNVSIRYPRSKFIF